MEGRVNDMPIGNDRRYERCEDEYESYQVKEPGTEITEYIVSEE